MSGTILDDVAYVFKLFSGGPAAASFSLVPPTPPPPGLSEGTVSLTTIASLMTAQPVSGCDNVKGIGFQDLLLETGSAQITFQNDDPDLALITTPNTLVNFYVETVLAFTMLAETWEAVLVDQGEEKNQATTWKGRGHTALLERGVMYPALFITDTGDARPIEEERTFNWSSWGHSGYHHLHCW